MDDATQVTATWCSAAHRPRSSRSNDPSADDYSRCDVLALVVHGGAGRAEATLRVTACAPHLGRRLRRKSMTREGESFRNAAIAFAADMKLQRCVRRAMRSGCK